MPALMASGRVGQASTSAASRGSFGAPRAPSAPDSAPRACESDVFPVVSEGCSSLVSPTLVCHRRRQFASTKSSASPSREVTDASAGRDANGSQPRWCERWSPTASSGSAGEHRHAVPIKSRPRPRMHMGGLTDIHVRLSVITGSLPLRKYRFDR
jgi:hypothetical protein